MAFRYRVTALAAAGVLLTGAVTACTPFGGDDGGGTGGGTSGSVGKPFVDDKTDPVVKGTFPSSIAQGAKLEIAIMGIKVHGKLAILTVRLTPQVPPGTNERIDPYTLNGKNGLGTALIDPINLKRYVVVKDSGNKELQSEEIFSGMPNNQATAQTYTFAAPPENVRSVDVQYGGWPTFRNVPIER